MTPRGRAKKIARPRVPDPLSESEPNSGSRTALQKHVDFFDSNHDGRITLEETYSGLEHFYNGSLFYTLARELKAREAAAR
jgi:Ca2+-binding EF-hand superfamily protein